MVATYAINTYRLPTILFVLGGQEMKSSEGTTQGDPLSIALYAISLQPLITRLHITSSAKQCWFADDASGAGTAIQLKKWWDTLIEVCPEYGYHPKDDKCWLITKPEKEEIIREIFKETEVKRHIGAVVGSRSYLNKYVNEKVEEWVKEIINLADFATTQPQASYAVYTFGLKHRWTYFLRTLPEIQDLLQPLEEAITKFLLPALVDHKCSPLEREILALPVKKGGIGVTNPCIEATLEYSVSRKVTTLLVEQIQEQIHELPDDSGVHELKQMARIEKNDTLNVMAKSVIDSAPPKMKRMIELASEKGASSWLTVVPVSEMDLNLNKREFRDALNLRYDWPFKDNQTRCACGDLFNIDHARGGFRPLQP